MSQFISFIPPLTVLSSSVVANNLDKVIENSTNFIILNKAFDSIDDKIFQITEKIPEISLMYILAQRPDLTPEKIKELIEETKPFKQFDFCGNYYWPTPAFCKPYRRFLLIQHEEKRLVNTSSVKLKSSSKIADIIIRTFKYYKDLIQLWNMTDTEPIWILPNTEIKNTFNKDIFAKPYTLDSFSQMENALSILEIESIKNTLSPYIEGIETFPDLEHIYEKFKRYLTIGNTGDIQEILQKTALRGHLVLIEKIMEAVKTKIIALPINGENSVGSALWKASLKGHAKIVEKIIEGVKEEIATIFPLKSWRSAGYALIDAAGGNHVKVVKKILKAVKNGTITLPIKGEFSAESALRIAAEEGHAAIIEVILEAVKAKTIFLSTEKNYLVSYILRIAAEEGYTAVTEVIQEAIEDKILNLPNND